jgi:hypothetical protein
VSAVLAQREPNDAATALDRSLAIADRRHVQRIAVAPAISGGHAHREVQARGEHLPAAVVPSAHDAAAVGAERLARERLEHVQRAVGERQVGDRVVALVERPHRPEALTEGLDEAVEAAEQKPRPAADEDDRRRVLDREVVDAGDRAGPGFTRRMLLWFVSTTYSLSPTASIECGTPSGLQSPSGPHTGSLATGCDRMKALMSAT